MLIDERQLKKASGVISSPIIYNKEYQLNMPQMLFGGLSENWISKEWGDIHWNMIMEGLGTASDQLTDSLGERLYASFVRICWQSENALFAFKENERFSIQSELSRYGGKMFFSDAVLQTHDKKIVASLMSVFSSRNEGDNTNLQKGEPATGKTTNIKNHDKLPSFAKTYLEAKSTWHTSDNNTVTHDLGEYAFPVVSENIYQCDYTIDPYDDVNGVGLLYFASYPKINDKCERLYFQEQVQREKGWKDWAEQGSTLARDVFFFGNANPGDLLSYRLDSCKFLEDKKVLLSSSLYRKKDGFLIARIFTIKELKEVREGRKKVTKSRSSHNKNQKGATTLLNKTELSKAIIDFFSSMLEIEHLDEQTNLKPYHIESIVYLELSEYLSAKHGILSNPSRFYGLNTVSAISAYLLSQNIDNKDDNHLFDQKNVTEERQEKLPSQKNVSRSKEEYTSDDIAIIGYRFRLPGAVSKQALWKLLKEKKSAISDTPSKRWNWPDWVDPGTTHQGINKGGYIEDIDKFDASFFRLSPGEVKLLDPQQRLLLELNWELLESSGYKASTLKESNTGVFIGASGNDYELLLYEYQSWHTLTGVGTSNALLANRLSYFYDFEGPSLQIDTACSSSLVALHEAVKSLQLKECDSAIVGGVHLMCHPSKSLAYYQSGMLSADGKCHTFDEKANGYVRGEGAVMMLLKPLSQAIKDQDNIKGVIKGTAINHGGQSGGITVPNPKKQQKLLEEVYHKAKIDVRTISYIEAHGTGTSLGDPIEVAGLTDAFHNLSQNFENLGGQTKSLNAKPKEKPWCGLGSIKTNIGHLEAAAGMAGMIKVLLSMEQAYLPSSINFEALNPKIELGDSAFYIEAKGKKWQASEDAPLRAGISSFGIGGTNAHVILESYNAPRVPVPSTPKAILLPLSAKNEVSLKAYVSSLISYLKTKKEVNLSSLAYTFQEGREEMESRLVVIAKDRAELQTALMDYISGKSAASSLITNSQEEMRKTIQLLSGQHDIPASLKAWISEGKLHEIGRLWVSGVVIDWKLFYSKVPPFKLDDVPVYPFQKKQYWFTDAVSKTPLNQEFPVKKVAIKKKVLQLFSEIMQLPEKDLDNEAFFMDFEVTSLHMIQLTVQLNELYSLNLKPIDLHSCLNIKELIEYLFPLIQKVSGENGFEGPQEKIVARHKPNSSIEEGYAIIGVNMLLPGAETLEEYWELLLRKEFTASDYPLDRWDRLPEELRAGLTPSDFKGNYLDNILGFDHRFFKLSARESMLMDPQQRLLIQSVWRAIENAGYRKDEFSKKHTSLYLSINAQDYAHVVKYDEHVDEFSGNGVSRYIAANRISHFFDLKGRSEPIDTACSSFFVGLDRAIADMRQGLSEQAIVAGVQVNLLPFEFEHLQEQGLLSEGGRTLPFDAKADGFIRGEGLGTMILKPLSKAIADKDHIYAVVKGVGVWHGGRSVGMTTPNAGAHEEAMSQAITNSGININELSYIEAHGTGMSLGDASELKAFSTALGKLSRDIKKPCLVSAVKSTIGHLEAASGVAVMLKAILSLRHGKLPGIGGFEKLHPDILAGQFKLSTETTNLPTATGKRCAGLHSYGLGGVSSFVVMEEHIAERSSTEEKVDNNPELFVLSAQSQKVLELYLEKIGEFLENTLKEETVPFSFSQLIGIYQCHRVAMKYRLAIIAESFKDLLSKIRAIKHGNSFSGIYFTSADDNNKTFTGDELRKFIEEENWESVAQAWVRGAHVLWQKRNMKRYPFPEYPFDTSRAFWISQSRNTIQEMENSETIKVEDNSYLMLVDD